MWRTESPQFAVGHRYRNRRGEYEVLSCGAATMTIRYDDGVIQTAAPGIQWRIHRNLEASAMQASPYRNAGRDRNAAFFRSVGFLSVRASMLEAIIQSNGFKAFSTRHNQVVGHEPLCGSEGLYIHSAHVDKWGCELRVTFEATEAEMSSLDFGPDVNVVENPSARLASWRINNNEFWWHLLQLGFNMGSVQDPERIRTRLPMAYISAFVEGVALARIQKRHP